MDSLIDQAKRLASISDDAGRRKLIERLRALSYSFENPDETLQRIIHYVSVSCWMICGTLLTAT